MIVQGAHAIRRGERPSFAPDPSMRRDLFLIERADARAAREEIVSLVCERLPGALRASIPSATSRCSRPCTAASSGSTRSTTPCATASTPTASRCAAAACGSATS